MRSFLLGAKTEVKSWTNPYVTDGLLAMWDGEWNAGGGKHDASAVAWKDLAGNNDLSIIGSDGWSSDYYALSGTDANYASGTLNYDILSNDFTIEFCAVILGVSGSGRFYGFNLSNGNQNYCDVGLKNYDASRLFNYGGLGFSPTGASLSAINPTIGNLLSSTIARSSGHSIIYSNGLQIFDPGTIAINENRNSVFTVGGGHNGQYGASANVHCVRIYNRALTAAEIAANYAIDARRFGL